MALTINGEHVPDRTLDRELMRLSAGLEMDAPEAGGIDPNQLRSLALRNVIDRTLLLQAAAERNLRVTADEVAAELSRRWDVRRDSVCDPGAMELLREDLLLQRMRTELTRHVPRPGRPAVEAFYQANAQHYRVREAVEAAHIQCSISVDTDEVAAHDRIAAAQAELQRGKRFAQVAEAYSDCKGVAGSVGWVTRGAMVPEFEDVVFLLKPGEQSPIFRTVFGWHIATVLQKRAEGILPFREVHLSIAKAMLDDARLHHLRVVLEQWKRQSDIRFTEDSATEQNPHG